MAIPQKADIDFESVARILNLPSPSSDGDAATKGYVDDAVEGLAWKDSVRVATQANINLAAPGATVDGVTLTTGDRMLVRSQTAPAENGIYVFNGAATPAARALDSDTAAELEQAVVSVEEGTSADTTYRQTEVNFVLDTGAVTFGVFGTAAPSASTTTAGIIEIATQTEVNTGTATDLVVTPETLANWSGRSTKYAETFGDGSATSYVITHNLNTKDITASVREVGGTERQVMAELRHTSVNSVTLLFAAAPSTNSLRITLMA